jgi:hypothetical protein
MNDKPHKYESLPTGEFDEDDHHTSRMSLKEKINCQNSNLDLLEKGVSRLGEISLMISNEIDSQNRSLSELELEMDDAQDRIELITRRTQDFVRQAVGNNFCVTIIILMVILTVLILLVLYT